MKNQTTTAVLAILLATVGGCEKGSDAAQAQLTTNARAGTTNVATPDPAAKNAEPAVVEPTDGPKTIVSVAVGSKDHTTLVAAVKAADYVDSLSNPGPLTVFAPTNTAFDKLPKGTVEGLLKPEKKADLAEVLKYHVAVSTYQLKDFKDGQTLGMANGGKVTFTVKDGKVTVNGANIIASIPASNGIVHVIDGVLLPAPK
jgi:uncharacterized surface protein with fasciclin (FAS1) repeats